MLSRTRNTRYIIGSLFRRTLSSLVICTLHVRGRAPTALLAYYSNTTGYLYVARERASLYVTAAIYSSNTAGPLHPAPLVEIVRGVELCIQQLLLYRLCVYHLWFVCVFSLGCSSAPE